MGGTVSSDNNGFTKETVIDQVNSNPVVMYSTTTCPHCTAAKKLLNTEGFRFQTYELDKMEDGRKLAHSVAQVTNWRAVPQIFICGQFIGGSFELHNLKEYGLLHDKIAQCENLSRSSVQ